MGKNITPRQYVIGNGYWATMSNSQPQKYRNRENTVGAGSPTISNHREKTQQTRPTPTKKPHKPTPTK
jgi:hypothetical protein